MVNLRFTRKRKAPSKYNVFTKIPKNELKYVFYDIPGHVENYADELGKSQPVSKFIITRDGSIVDVDTGAQYPYSINGSLDARQGNFLHLPRIKAGTGYNERIGNSIVGRSVHVRLQFRKNIDLTYAQYAGAAPTTYLPPLACAIRVILLWDKANAGLADGSALEPNLFIKNGGLHRSAGTGYANLYGTPNPDNSDRFVFLYDNVFHNDNDNGEKVLIAFDKKFKIEFKYNGTTATSNVMTNSNMWLVLLPEHDWSSDTAAKRYKMPVIDGFVKFCYTDE